MVTQCALAEARETYEEAFLSNRNERLLELRG